MLCLILNIFYAVLWLCILFVALTIGACAFFICLAWPPGFLLFGGIALFLCISCRKNLGVKGVQSIFPSFRKSPAFHAVQVMKFLR